MTHIMFDRRSAKAFVTAYQRAVRSGKTRDEDVFIFEDAGVKHEVLITYAEYTIEYLSMRGLLDKANTASNARKLRAEAA